GAAIPTSSTEWLSCGGRARRRSLPGHRPKTDERRRASCTRTRSALSSSRGVLRSSPRNPRLSATELRPVLVGLPPLIDERSRVLVLGSFPSKQSLEKQEYYGNRQNHFWQIMGLLFSFDPQTPYGERR